MIITITAPSGAGKSTLTKGLMETFPDSRPLESITTRPQRDTDSSGEYVYVTQEAFQSMLDQGEFLWHVQPHGSPWYGTRKGTIDAALESQNYFFASLVPSVVEPLHTYAHTKGKGDAVRSLYLYLDNEEEQRRRILERNDNTADLEKRLLTRSWNELAHKVTYPLRILDVTQPREQVLTEAVRYITE